MFTTVAALAIAGVAVASMASSSNATASATEESVKERTQTFAIANMTCAMCPITVKKAMEKVEGVRSVDVDFDAKTATVVYDPSTATVDQITEASTNAGYPASVTDA